MGMGRVGLARARGLREEAPQNSQSTCEKKAPPSPIYFPLLQSPDLCWCPTPNSGPSSTPVAPPSHRALSFIAQAPPLTC